MLTKKSNTHLVKGRIAFLRIAQETNALSPVLTELTDFKRTVFMEKNELLKACLKDGNEAPGFTKNAELSGFIKAWQEDGCQFELCPLFSAWAIPAGPLSTSCFAYFKDRIAQELKELTQDAPLTGVFFSMHGAMCAQGSEDPEGELLELIRKILGAKTPVAVSCDLHAQITAKKIDNTDVLRAYHTNPHRDHFATGYKTAQALFQVLHGIARPTSSWRALPLVLGGGTTLDFLPPMRKIFKRMKYWEKDPRVLCVSITNVQIWHDDPRLGWATFVMTNNAPDLAEQIAEELAEMCWAVRHKQPPRFLNAQETFAKIQKMRIRPKLGVTCICDASDVVGAGAPGENTRLIKAALEYGKGLMTYAPIRDAVLVDQLWGKKIGEEYSVKIGGKIHPEMNDSLSLRMKLICQKRTENFDRILVLEAEDLRLVVTEGVPLVMKPDFYMDAGLSIWKADVVIVKSFFPFRLFFAPYSRRTFYVRTKGITDFEAGLQRVFDGPIYPKDEVSNWHDTDMRRRLQRSHEGL